MIKIFPILIDFPSRILSFCSCCSDLSWSCSGILGGITEWPAAVCSIRLFEETRVPGTYL